jgi:L-alanine-DL-glutamate epimerase-like enolase superfamily enzyme
VDGRLGFRLDPNQGWCPDEAVRISTSLADRGAHLQYMEQPIQVDSHESLNALRNRTQQPIPANEDNYISHNLRRIADCGTIDAAVVDLKPASGITELRQRVAIADDAGSPLAHHCAFDLEIRTPPSSMPSLGSRSSTSHRFGL